MSEIKVNMENIETLKQQFSEWAFYLNNCVEVLVFTLALASLGTKSPSTNALISFIFLSTVCFSGSRNKLELLKKLRKKKNKI